MVDVDLLWYSYCAGASCIYSSTILPYSFYNLIGVGIYCLCRLEGKLRLTQDVIDKVAVLMQHTKMNGDVNWKDGDEIDVCLGGHFAGDKFISIINRTRSNTTKR